MSEIKLTINQLKNYLGTGVKYISRIDERKDFYEFEDREGYEDAFNSGSIWEFVGWTDIEIPLGDGELSGELLSHEKEFYRGNYRSHKPMFFRLTDLDKFIPELGFVPLEELNRLDWSDVQLSLLKNGAYTHVSFDLMQKMFEWNFWVFDQKYFEQGLVIDKLKSNENEPETKN
jgi:hypothetical protein